MDVTVESFGGNIEWTDAEKAKMTAIAEKYVALSKENQDSLSQITFSPSANRACHIFVFESGNIIIICIEN